MGSRGGAAAREGGTCPPSKGGAPFRVPPNPRRMGPWGGGGAPAHFGLVPFLIQPMRPSGRGGPSRWTPRTPSVAPVQYRCAPETSRCPYDDFPYINLYLRTIPKLLVTSGISSGTPNNIRVTAHTYPYNPSVTEP